MKKWLCYLLLSVCITATAQTYRMVNDKIYRTDDPSVWRTFSDLQITGIDPSGALWVHEVFQNTQTY